MKLDKKLPTNLPPLLTSKPSTITFFDSSNYSRDFKIPVVVLSSMNRMSYADVISMAALKESGAIEYTADVCLGLQHVARFTCSLR